MITHRTNNAAINWILDRCAYTNIATEELVYSTGTFRATIPYQMRQQLRDFARSHGGCARTGAMQSYKLIDTYTESTHHRVSIRWSFGSFRSNANVIDFMVTEELIALTPEDVAELKAAGLL